MCEIYDDGDRASVWNETARRAAKPHRCEGCGAVILPGETYCFTSGVSDHRGFSERGCAACAATRIAFSAAHGMSPAMYDLASTLHECIAEGDAASKVWQKSLDALRVRNQQARVAQAVTKAFAGWFEARPVLS